MGQHLRELQERGLQITCVYRAFDIDDYLLYIGISDDLGSRLRRHDKDSRWFDEVTDGGRLEFEWVWGTRREIEQYEKELIQSEQPLYNVTHNTKNPHRVDR